MPWKFVCDLRFPEVLQTTIISRIKKENEEIIEIKKKIDKNSKNCVQIAVC